MPGPTMTSRHIRHSQVDRKDRAWCGAPLTSMDWTFLDIDHATYSREQHSMIAVCPQCRVAVIKVLRGRR